MISINLNYFVSNIMTRFLVLSLLMILNSCTDNSDNTSNTSPNPIWYRPSPPIVRSDPVIFVRQTKAVLSGFVNTWGNPTEIRFDYGTTLSYEYSILAPPMDHTTGYPSITITGLLHGTTYYYRLRATNIHGTAYGLDESFITLKEGESGIIFNPDLIYDTITDIDANTYKTIQIGTQTWMVENLRTTRLNDAASIKNVTDVNAWVSLTTPAYCWYNNDSAIYKLSNGALYNWHAVNTGKLCPTGWHVPTSDEWTTLINYLGGNDLALGKLQENGYTHWLRQNPDATNSSGFTALPCGCLIGAYAPFVFEGLGTGTSWYSSSLNFDLVLVWTMTLSYPSSFLSLGITTNTPGFSIRCMKD